MWYYIQVAFGEVSEWFKELVLKTSDAKAPRVRISASPFLYLYDCFTFTVAVRVWRSTQVGEEAPLLRV